MKTRNPTYQQLLDLTKTFAWGRGNALGILIDYNLGSASALRRYIDAKDLGYKKGRPLPTYEDNIRRHIKGVGIKVSTLLAGWLTKHNVFTSSELKVYDYLTSIIVNGKTTTPIVDILRAVMLFSKEPPIPVEIAFVEHTPAGFIDDDDEY